MSLSSLGNPQCINILSDPAFIAAKKTNDDAQAAATTAAAELTAANTAVSDAEAAQKVAIKACECEAHKTYESEYEKANTRSDEDLAAWKKGKHMKCVLAGTDPSSCSVGAPPHVTRRALAQGVDQSACEIPRGNDGNGGTFPIVSAGNSQADMLANAMSACEAHYGAGTCGPACGSSAPYTGGCSNVIVGNAECNGHLPYAWCLTTEHRCGSNCGWPAARWSNDGGSNWAAYRL